MNAIAIGSKLRFRYDHLFETVTFSAFVVKVEGERAYVRIPPRIRQLPFPPFKGFGHFQMKITGINPDLAIRI